MPPKFALTPIKCAPLDQLGVELGRLHQPCGAATQSAMVVISDQTVATLHGERVRDALNRVGARVDWFTITPGEASKSLETAGRIYSFLTEKNFPRDGIIVALGGGVVSDLAGFVAATWMRGVRWIVCPTTLEAQVDAAIGGKTAINIPGGKNLVGAFHAPSLVLIDTSTLRTLPERDVRAGLAESIKHALISSEDFLSWHEARAAEILALEAATIEELIRRNVLLKSSIVARDPFERTGERMVLNFGHTVGHAIEECSGFELRHGECVALGMIVAARVSELLGLLDATGVSRVVRVIERFGLPTTLTKPIPLERIAAAIQKDKKNQGGAIRFVVLEEIGKARNRENVDVGLIAKAYALLM